MFINWHKAIWIDQWTPPQLVMPRQPWPIHHTISIVVFHYFRLQCVPVSIRKVKRYGTTGQIYGEDPNTYFKILVEFVIFQPSAGSQVTGQVNRLSNSHLGLLVHEWFNASISRNYNDELHTQVGAGDTVLVEIIKTNVARRMISLECKLISIL